MELFITVFCVAAVAIDGCGPNKPPYRSSEVIFGEQEQFKKLNYQKVYDFKALAVVGFFMFEAVDIQALKSAIVSEKFEDEAFTGVSSDDYGAGPAKPPSWWDPSTLDGKRSVYRLQVKTADNEDLRYDIFLHASDRSRRFFVVQTHY
ncbi:hypothetical protein SAMN05444166_8173 [Singulisphaera sp. GP187]|uniref:hypothetical protein n=1 Tax=Singulisphaera sp. GP187 TaxID=1882752 RepID=UPI0009269E11|nr:hypothetical protein [Singulisphaera sp. GP187]SIO66668.1 hypothetical protein SAMN05444166_8173 [Singulisphaera sp. GP187]